MSAIADGDPLEPVNRVVYGFNEAADILVLRPAAEVYRGTVPTPVRMAVRNFLLNLTSPLLVANELLQGDFEGAQVAFSRFLVNTTIGLGGAFDIAGRYRDLHYEYEDFGQTLAVWGVPDGPYLVLPLLGPSNLRDATGLVADTAADPVNIWANNADRSGAMAVRAGVTGVDTRTELIEAVDDLRRNSLDPYASARSLYRQRRATEINDGSGGSIEFPDYEDIDEPAVENGAGSSNSN
ncbi:VacJ family lipoprotein [Arenibaculum sp.]|uniref:MlaA family lipoprotein n=1 Tax=Arenibaculum sp. TaxID=2865862 RepID=UPI002E144BDE|nr:VacJ family lipoprotein [Arenibaculum sp.]